MFQRDQAVRKPSRRAASSAHCVGSRTATRCSPISGVTGLSADVAGGGRCGEEPYVRALAGAGVLGEEDVDGDVAVGNVQVEAVDQ